MGRIVVAITTRNRPDDLERCLSAWDKFYSEIPILIVDDASDEAVIGANYRFDKRAGIPRAKNKCIELAINGGYEHIILADDDCFPTRPGGIEKYVESPYSHMCYTFLKGRHLGNGYKIHNLGNGCLMYFNKIVFDTIGGFDTAFGLGKYEHSQLSHRCYHNGLSPHPFIDFIGSGDYFHCLDQDGGHKRTLTNDEMSELLKDGRKHFYKTLASKEFIPYI